MFPKINTNINFNIKRFLQIFTCAAVFMALVLTLATNNGYDLGLSNKSSNKGANAAAPNTGDLIIGKTDTGSAIEYTVCVKATDGPIHLTNVSHWVQFDNSVLTPSPIILEKGVYGNGNNGYSQLKWQQVQPAPVAPSTNERWTLRLDFIGDVNTPGLDGIAMQSAAPELYGKVRFDKIPGAPGSQAIDLVPNQNKYFSTESPLERITQTVYNVSGDCRNSVCPANSNSPSGYNTSPGICTSTCAAGTFLNAVGSVCTPCPVGYSCTVNTSTPVLCPANTYCELGSASPTACPANTSSPAGSDSASDCLSTCTAGTFLNSNTAVCDPCPAGSFCPAQSSVPTLCPANSYCTAGVSTPTTCPANTSSPAGSTSASACTSTCAAGTYLNASVCTPCPAGSTCAGGAALPVTCAAGTYCPAGSSVSIPCTAGNYCPAGTGSQIVCTAGSYCAAGATTPTACPANTSSPAGSVSASDCLSTCAAGTSLNGTTSACDPCTVGQYCPGPVPPTLCPVNSYCPTPGPAPIPCPANTSSPAGSTSASACTSTCAAGTSFNSTTSTCDPCTVGQYCPGPVPPTLCPVNSYCPTPGPAPIPCPANTSSPAGSTSASACTSTCAAGTFLVAATSTCNPCPAGSSCVGPNPPATCPVNTYCPPSTPVPIPCPANQISPAGSTSLAACITPACTNGATNFSACNICPATLYYNSTTSACTPCPSGYICPGPTPPELCIAGFVCPPNVVIPVPCPANTTSPAGSTNLNQCTSNCTAGTYLNAGICSPCPAGSRCDGPTPPTPCPVNTYCPNPPGPNPIPCPINTISPVGSDSLSDCINNCPANTYSNGAICTPCPVGTNSAIGSTSVSNCSQPSGGVIIITERSSSSSVVSSSSATVSSAAQPIKAAGIFQSVLRITDPYICGEGSYGNVPNPKKFGVDFVYYDFYKTNGSNTTSPSYKFKLRLNEQGDFFLPISPDTNVIADGRYKVVFYAFDNLGNKAQGEYTDDIKSDCGYVINNNLEAIRTGGLQTMAILATMAILILAIIQRTKLNRQSKIK